MKTLGNLKKTIDKYDPNIASIFLPWALRHPRYLRSFIRLKKSYLKSEDIRTTHRGKDLRVPPFLILSVTPRCNLNCKSCYASAAGNISNKRDSNKTPLKLEQWAKILEEAKDLGVFGFVLAGGEPFLFPDLLKLCTEFKDRFFIILTNGTKLRTDDFQILKKMGNVAVIVSIEGGKILTDKRRGQGVYDKAIDTLSQLNKYGIINGVSTTVNKTNYEYWMNHETIDYLIDSGIRIGIFIEHIPTTNKKQDMDQMLTKRQRENFRSKILEYRDNKSLYIVHSPGDEDFFGGCVSAGRGFAHVTPSGDLTPCPVSNIATHNLTCSSLKEALASPLFKKIRESEHLLETEGMPCALFAHPKEVDELAKSVDAYKTDF